MAGTSPADSPHPEQHIGRTLSQLIDPHKFRHGWPDHEYARYLNTGDPLRAYCGQYLPAERIRCTSVCDQPLPDCPGCLKAWARINQKAAA